MDGEKKKIIKNEGRTAWQHPGNFRKEVGKVSVGERMHSNMGILLSLFLNFKGEVLSRISKPCQCFWGDLTGLPFQASYKLLLGANGLNF